MKINKTMHSRKSTKPFFQILVMVFVCLVLISLFLIMGFMNLRALDKTLTGFTENRGASIIRNVQQVAQNYYERLTRIPQHALNPNASTPFGDYSLTMPESFLLDLTELARALDLRWERQIPTPDQIASFVSDENVSLVAFLDDMGNPNLKNKAIPGKVMEFINPVVTGDAALKTNLFNRDESLFGLNVLTLRRKSGRGVIVIGLDDRSFKQRSLQFSFKNAVKKVGLSEETAYFILQDYRGREIGLSGDLLENRMSEVREKGSLQSAAPFKSRKIHLADQDLLEIVRPIFLNGEYGGMLGLGLRMDASERIMEGNRNGIILSTGFMIVIAFLSMGFLYVNQNRYLHRIQAMERRMNQVERLSAMGRLAAGVAHEIRNPLNAVSIAVQRIQRDAPHKLIDVIRDEIKRLNQIVEDFLGVSKSGRLQFKRSAIMGLMEEVLLLMREELESREITLETRWHTPLPLMDLDQEKIKQALINILKNAMESISGQGSIVISAQQADKEWLSIKINDTGVGISSDKITQIFEPDYTTKDKGLGLGLPLAHEIIRGHGGEIRVTSQQGVGTTFEILLLITKH